MAGKIERIRNLLDDPFAGFQQLTLEEREALKWASRGFTGWEIAKILDISEEAANFRVRQGYLKLGMKKFELARWVFDQISMIVK